MEFVDWRLLRNCASHPLGQGFDRLFCPRQDTSRKKLGAYALSCDGGHRLADVASGQLRSTKSSLVMGPHWTPYQHLSTWLLRTLSIIHRSGQNVVSAQKGDNELMEIIL